MMCRVKRDCRLFVPSIWLGVLCFRRIGRCNCMAPSHNSFISQTCCKLMN